MHDRFKRKVWAFKSDFTGSLAKWLVKQSPYIVPNDLAGCITKFHARLDEVALFELAGMAEIELYTLTEKVNSLLENIPEIMALNEPKITRASPFNTQNPDHDFIDIMAVARNITCDFAERADAEAYLDLCKASKNG